MQIFKFDFKWIIVRIEKINWPDCCANTKQNTSNSKHETKSCHCVKTLEYFNPFYRCWQSKSSVLQVKMLPVWASIDVFNTRKQFNTHDFSTCIPSLPLCWLFVSSKHRREVWFDRYPYGDLVRDSRRVTGPSPSSPVYQTINGPRQQKKMVSQSNTHIDKNT